MRTPLPGSTPPDPAPSTPPAAKARKPKAKPTGLLASRDAVLPRADNADLAATVAGIRPAVLQFATPPCLGDTATAHAAFLDWVKRHGQPLPKAWSQAWTQFCANAECGMRNAESPNPAPAPPASSSPFVGQGERVGERGEPSTRSATVPPDSPRSNLQSAIPNPQFPAPAPGLHLAPRPQPVVSPLVAAARRLAALRAGAQAAAPVPAVAPASLLPSAPLPPPPDAAPALTGEQLEQIICAALQFVANLHVVRDYRQRVKLGEPTGHAIKHALGLCGASHPHGGWDTLMGWFRVRPGPDALEIPWSAVAAVADRVVLPDSSPSPLAEPGERDGERGTAPAFDLPSALRLLNSLRPFLGHTQYLCVRDALKGEEGEWFATTLAELDARITAMPQTYGTDGAGDEAIVHLHYFKGGADWFITEKDKGDPDDKTPPGQHPRQHQAFGLADLFGDGGELGYISLEELTSKPVDAELDFHWKPRPLAEVRRRETATL